jgi:NAD(P)-dependent dehydrogenase (short-subunit alcohol dehydrogenase family)
VRVLGASALPVIVDVTRLEDIRRLVGAAEEKFGYIHGWVNNAGSASAGDVGRLIDLDEGQWDRVVDLNMKWVFSRLEPRLAP